LVYVHSNVRLLENTQAVNYVETTVLNWNNGLLLILTYFHVNGALQIFYDDDDDDDDDDE